MPDRQPQQPGCAAQLALGRVFASGRGTAASKSCRIRATPTRRRCSAISRPRSRTKARIARPMVRRGWLEHGPGADRRRGATNLSPVSWAEALDLVAGELRRDLRRSMGRAAVFGGSYGWASAGRFHDAQHQIHRFLNLAGGYVRSVNSYSSGAATVILPHVDRPAGGGRRQQCQLGRTGRRERAGAGLWRHGAEKQRCRRRRHQPAHRPRQSARGAQARASNSI